MSTSKRGDYYSGIPWVYVEPEKARAHPKGKLNAVMWLIVAYFLAVAVLKVYLSFRYGAGFAVAFLNAIWPLLAGLGLALRVPWSIVMAMVSAGLTIYALLQGVEGPNPLLTLGQTIINVGILFYLIDGDRPNLIYRHRYRKYSVENAETAEDA